ncbi:hypothetical protein LC608_34000 [Nostoc sp. XA010]|uniref:hypothetical protein n=1 Tax=Nostoc sp. XA010 TaxID=2780407 RepID=UPI001E42DDF4|nr:hypothetical protein [Nostoc sp. XA010]MCC5661870.1 hypothetical protein [Nostoc sp. XA010]
MLHHATVIKCDRASEELAIARQETRQRRRRSATQLPVKPTTPNADILIHSH